MSNQILLGFLLLAPLMGFLFNGISYRSSNYKLSGSIASAACLISFICSFIFFFRILEIENQTININYFTWILIGDLNLGVDFTIDPISLVMLLVVTGVGFLIHLFSIGYMSHDNRPSKYFSYLNLFLFNMLILVLGSNLPVMFVGWEGVGLCSYLLIGFWFSDEKKAAAGMKAFITNRIGDAAFLIGMFILFTEFQSLDFQVLATSLPDTAQTGFTSPLSLACLLLFIGATGKSAQIPLYVWLPDAMAGPTPVSALIHAATMVTAGIYMIIRMSAIFMLAPDVMSIIAWTGALTAFFASTIALSQWDIKKILAYSTISQLGYMFLAVGVGAFIPALFHLVTHAFFKALLFLGSGSLIHSLHGEQDIRKMGGLRKFMPITHITFSLGFLAIIGLPPFAGFFSKDEILWMSFISPRGSSVLWFIGLVTAGLTAFYMTRLMALTFWSESRIKKDTPKESSFIMTLPLIVLGFLSVVGGWIGISHLISDMLPGHIPNLLHNFAKDSVSEVGLPDFSKGLEFALMLLSIFMAVAGAGFAYLFYMKRKDLPQKFVQKIKYIHKLSYHKYRIDEVYERLFIAPLIFSSKRLWLYIDVSFIDRATYLISDFLKSSGQAMRTFQSGSMQKYALNISLGLVFIIIFVLVRL